MKKILIAAASPAGGVGKSTISKELACIYASTKLDGIPLRTCLVDANLIYGSQRALFGIGKTRYDIYGLIEDYRKDLKELGYDRTDEKYDWDLLQKYLTYARDRNVYLLPAPETRTDINVELPEADVLFRMLMKHFDVVIVDTANDASGLTNAAILLSSYTAFIAVDDERSIEKMLQMRRVLNAIGCGDRLKEKCGIVYNMYRTRKERYIAKEELEERLQLPVIAMIPYYRDLWTFNNRRVTLAGCDTPVSESLRNLAGKLVPDAGIKKEKRAFFRRLFG